MTLNAAVVLNPRAKRGDLRSEEVVECLAQHGVHAVALPVGADGLEGVLRQALTGTYDALIVGGGDGSLSTASNVLCEATIPLGVLPLGTANDFARSLGIPPDLDAACGIIGGGHTVAVDVGVANGRCFLNAASLGLPAKVTAEITPALKKRFGTLAYPIAATRAFFKQRPFTVTLTVDGRRRRIRWVMQLAVGSGRYYGGGMTVTAGARPTDGYLHVHVITAPNLGALLWTLRHLRSGRYARGDSALRFRARSVRIQTRRRHRINADGELIGTTPLEVTVRPRCLRVFAPDQQRSSQDETGAEAV